MTKCDGICTPPSPRLYACRTGSRRTVRVSSSSSELLFKMVISVLAASTILARSAFLSSATMPRIGTRPFQRRFTDSLSRISHHYCLISSCQTRPASDAFGLFLADRCRGGAARDFVRRRRTNSRLLASSSSSSATQTTTDSELKKGSVRLSHPSKSATDSASPILPSKHDEESTPVVTPEEATPAASSQRPFRRLRTGLSSMMTGVGFVSSATIALVSNRAQYRRWKPSVQMLQNFLKSTGIDLELAQALNVRLLDNTIILGRIQKLLDGTVGSDIRDRVLAHNNMFGWGRRQTVDNDVLYDECLRYMKYATAAYGESMIRAAELDVSGTFDSRFMPVTRTRISEHIGVPESDIVVLDVDYDGDVEHLRHIVAVDHTRRAVVLAIRGTFSLGELVVDVAGFSRPFCGGEAHAEMANMTERVWQVAGPTVLQLLEENKGYELILTGHSLGAGTASLLNIMCHQRGRALVKGRQVRCFAFACPPVYTPLEFAAGAAQHCVSVIHERDVVPFLSVDTVRHFFGCIRAIEDHVKDKGFRKRMSYVTGYADLDPALVEAVRRASRERLPPKQGAPILVIPAATNLWLRQAEGDAHFDLKECDSVQLSTLGIRIDPSMLHDHLPPRYEHALYNLKR